MVCIYIYIYISLTHFGGRKAGGSFRIFVKCCFFSEDSRFLVHPKFQGMEIPFFPNSPCDWVLVLNRGRSVLLLLTPCPSPSRLPLPASRLGEAAIFIQT